MENCTNSNLQRVKGRGPIILNSFLGRNMQIAFVLLALFSTHYANSQNTTYTTSWLGNSGAMNTLYVQPEMHNLWVSPEGTSYTNTWWDESHHQIGVYSASGAVQPHLSTVPYGSEVGGNNVAIFAADGTTLGRYLRSGGTQSATARVTGTAIMGIAANETEVFVSSLNGRIYVYNATTLASVRNFNINASGRLTLDGAGFLWAITGNTTLKRYSNTGVLQSQSITLPAGNIAAAVTVNKNNNTLYVIDRGTDQNIKVYNTVTTSPTRTTDFGVVGGILSGTRPGLVGPLRFSFNAIVNTGIAGHVFGTCGIGLDNSGNIYVLHGINSAAHIEKYNASGSMQWRLIGHSFEESAYIDPTTDETDVYAGGHHYKMNYGAAANTEMASWYGWGATINESNAYNAAERGVSFAGLSPIRITNISGSKFIYMQGQTGNVYVYRMQSNSETLVNVGITNDSPTWTKGSINDVDANGAMWSGDNLGIIEKYPVSGVIGGVPQYNFSSPTTYTTPAPYAGQYVGVEYIAETDVMYLSGGANVSRYNNWSTSRTLVYTKDMAAFNQPDFNSLAVAGDYIFTGYWTGFGAVKVWNANTGAFVTDLVAPANYNARDADNLAYVQAFKRSSGEYIVTAIDYYNNKTVVFRWCPSGNCTSSTVAVTGVTVSPTTASIAVGSTTTLTATVSPSNATNQNVTWSSSNTSIATVNTNGVVIGVAAGSATITVTTTDGSKTATCAVTVTSSNVAVTGVAVSPTTASVAIGSTTTLTATISPSNATNKNVTWSSSNTSIATVNTSGVVTGVAAGSATITATSAADATKQGTSTVTVTGTGGGTGTWTKIENTATGWVTIGADTYSAAQNSGGSTWSLWRANALAQYTFTGTQVQVYSYRARAMVAGNIYIDNVLVGSNVAWSQSPAAYQQLVWQSATLSNASHTIKIVTTGDYVEVDYLSVLSGGGREASANVENEQLFNTVDVYPNPAKNFVIVDFKSDLTNEEAQVDIVDLVGKRVYNSGVLSRMPSLKINTSEYPKGAYIISVRRGFGKFNKKLIVE